jgi:hypothetical protein
LTYTDFYTDQPHTAALLEKLMTARGVSTTGHAVEPSACYDCLQTRPEQARAVLERDERMEKDYAAGRYDWQRTSRTSPQR